MQVNCSHRGRWTHLKTSKQNTRNQADIHRKTATQQRTNRTEILLNSKDILAPSREPQARNLPITLELLMQRPQRNQRMPDGLFMLTGLQHQPIPKPRAAVASQRGDRPLVEELERTVLACGS